jgi:NADH-quinone oxidoreductase subunit N
LADFDIWANLLVILPEIGLTILAVVVLFLVAYLPRERSTDIAYVTAFGFTLLVITPFLSTAVDAGVYWGGMITHDTFSQIFKVMIFIGAAITALIASADHGVARRPEFYLVIVVATLGASIMTSAADLIMVFIALETISIPLYVLAAFNRQDERSAEAGLKYFLFGSFASAFLLYGLSLLYGFAGTTSVAGIAEVLATGAVSLIPVLAAMVMIMIGFGFKISMVPFHFWTPDVYEGAPTSVTAYLSVVSKAASFALLVRFFMLAFAPQITIDGQSLQMLWATLFAVLAVVTMTVGNVLALRQTNIKRLLAYSSIAQAGYLLIGVAAMQSNTDFGAASIAFYLFMYTFTNLLAFAVIIVYSENTSGDETIKGMAGLNRRNAWLALVMTIALLSLGGIPPAAGFFGKFFLFTAAVDANLVGLAMIGVLNAIVALYYYLVVIKVMYVDQREDDAPEIVIAAPYGLVFAVSAVAVLLLGTVAATPFFTWAQAGAQVIMGG